MHLYLLMFGRAWYQRKATIFQIRTINGSNYSKDELNSAGGQAIVLIDENFGPVLNKVTYGPEGFGITAKNLPLGRTIRR